MTTRENISIPNVAEPADPRAGSQCIREGNLLFISGQIAFDNGELVGPDDPLEQCRQCLRHIESYVSKAGGTLDDVVSLDIFLTDIHSLGVRGHVDLWVGRVPRALVTE